MPEQYYLTTSAFYPNAEPHIGSGFEMIGTDVAARYHRLRGDEVYFLTGLDEHGEKIQRRAEQRGLTPQAHVDEMAEKFASAWRALDISYDDLLRTTEPRHEAAVTEMWNRCKASGDIYKDHYTGWYCNQCERYFPENQLGPERACPTHNKPLEQLDEDAYFFRLDRYADKLLAWYDAHPEFIKPDSRANESRRFIEQGLEPLCVSRTSIDWGVPVPDDPEHVMYVWFDAVTFYSSSAGFGTDEARFKKWWPADAHIIGKDILRFHTIIWPAMLMSAGLELPRQVDVHGFIHLRVKNEAGQEEDVKISKSILSINVEDVVAQYGTDALRYYLMREVPFLGDGNYSEAGLVERFNSDLANDLGNLLNRSLAMIHKYRGGTVPEPRDTDSSDTELQELAAGILPRLDEQMCAYALRDGLETIWELVTATNQYIEKNQPWVLAKDDAKADRLDTVLYTMAEATRIITVLVWPFIPGSARKMADQLACESFPGTLPEAAAWGGLRPGTEVQRGKPVFPRIETE